MKTGPSAVSRPFSMDAWGLALFDVQGAPGRLPGRRVAIHGWFAPGDLACAGDPGQGHSQPEAGPIDEVVRTHDLLAGASPNAARPSPVWVMPRMARLCRKQTAAGALALISVRGVDHRLETATVDATET